MPWRSRLMASTRSSRSVVSAVCWVSTSRSSSSARRLTAPSRSRSRRSFSRFSSISASGGSSAPGSISASAGDRVRLDFEHVVDFALDIGKPALGALHALLGAGAGLAGAGERFERSLGVAVGLRHHALGGGQRVGGDAAGAFGGFDFVDQRAALFGKHRRRIFELGALGRDFGDAGLDGGDLRGRALLAVLPFGALGQDRLHAAVGQFGLARQRLGFGPHLRGEAAMAVDVGANGGEPASRCRGSAAIRPARRRRSHARLRPRCDRRRGGYGLRSAPICARRGG